MRWQREELPEHDVRPVSRENLHVTIAFLGSRPADEVDAIAGALRAAVDGVAPPVLDPLRYRETRAVGMLVFDDEDGRATRIAEDVHRRLAELGVYEPERRPWLPHLTVVRFRERPRLRPSIPDLGPVTMSDAAVYISRLRPTGAQYEVCGIRSTRRWMRLDREQVTRRRPRPDRAPVRQGLGHAHERRTPTSRRARSRPGRSRSTSPSEWGGFHAAGSSRSSAPSRRGRRPSSTT